MFHKKVFNRFDLYVSSVSMPTPRLVLHPHHSSALLQNTWMGNRLANSHLQVKFSDALMPECIRSSSKSDQSVCNKDEEGKRDGSAGRGKSQAWHAGVTKAVSSFAVMPFLHTEDGVSRLLQVH